MNKITFEDLDLIEPLLNSLRKEGYKNPTPIQQGAIPEILKGADILGLAQTGTGKTAAFALPTLQNLADGHRAQPKFPRALVITPTRELAIQVGRSFTTYGKNLNLKTCVIYGGVGQQPQAKAIARGVDMLVATPGRLLDLMGQRIVDLRNVEILILDEADRLLDMGFITDIKKVVDVMPDSRQTLFFSATMPPAVEQLSKSILKRPVKIRIDSKSVTADNIDQKVMFVGKGDKELLLRDILEDESIYRVLVFTRTKHRANRVADRLHRHKIKAEAIHGNKSQGARQRALKGFIKGEVRVLVATDIAARGIDIDEISHVINFELPNEPESYVHRIGRTARAGAEGIAVSFCEPEERPYLAAIERVIKKSIPIDRDHQYHSDEAENAPVRGSGPARGGGGRSRGGDERGGRNGVGRRGDAQKGKKPAWFGRGSKGGKTGGRGKNRTAARKRSA